MSNDKNRYDVLARGPYGMEVVASFSDLERADLYARHIKGVVIDSVGDVCDIDLSINVPIADYRENFDTKKEKKMFSVE